MFRWLPESRPRTYQLFPRARRLVVSGQPGPAAVTTLGHFSFHSRPRHHCLVNYRISALKTSLTDSLEECGAGGLDRHVRVEQHRLEEGLGEGGQLGDQRSQPQVRPQTVVRQAAHPVMCIVRQLQVMSIQCSV